MEDYSFYSYPNLPAGDSWLRADAGSHRVYLHGSSV